MPRCHLPWPRLRLLLCIALASIAAPALAQTGTLQVPARRPVEAPPSKPAAAPRPPVHQVAPARSTPVVRAHAPAHPSKPPAERQPPHPLPPHPLPPLPPAAPPAPAIIPPPQAVPAKPSDAEKAAAPARPLPRFAALRADDVNMRAGPGTRYPIEWVYKRRDLPVEIDREFEVWRLVRDADGVRGWVHQATLTGRRTFEVTGADATLRVNPRDDASPVAVLKVGVIGRVRSCEAKSDWCRVQVGEYSGYLRRSQFWGTLPDEVIAP